jgi:CheY-like chemotaxis protein
MQRTIPHGKSIDMTCFGEGGERVHSLERDGDKLGRVLVADDDKEMRLLLSTVLRKDGFEVVEAQTGAEALDLLSTSLAEGPSYRYDLIISDVRMPCLGGLDVLAGLRETNWVTPVILITAFGGSQTHEEASRWGATAVFDKPFNVNDLRRVVTSLVAR